MMDWSFVRFEAPKRRPLSRGFNLGSRQLGRRARCSGRTRKRSNGIPVKPFALHLEGLLEDGEPIPEPQTAVAYVELQGAG